jgi:2-dehydropantoate 2-reductase
VKHAILGVGAVGGVIGSALASLGEDVIAIVRPEKLSSHPEHLNLQRPSQALSGSARKLASLTESVDVLWIATKAYQLQDALQSVRAPHKLVVPLLKGIDHVASLRSRYGHDRVVPATIAVEAELLAPGHFMQRSPFVRLNLAASAEPVLGGLVAKLRELEFTCQFLSNEQTLLWSKLCFLAPFAFVTTASGKDRGEIFADPARKRQLYSGLDETCAVATASGAEIDVAKLRETLDLLPPGMRSSMAKDLAANRKIELDAIAGPIVRGGERHKINIPTVKNLVSSIEALTRPRH